MNHAQTTAELETKYGVRVKVRRARDEISLSNATTDLYVPAMLTPDEARTIARALYADADAIEKEKSA